MKISANAVQNNVIIEVLDASGDAGFIGYQLERMTAGGAWLVWDGAGWSNNPPALLPTNKFADFGLSNGLFQYRYLVGGGTVYAYSDWVKIGSSRIGWTLGNYVIPEGFWGEILTPDDLRYTYLWGIDFRANNNEIFTDYQVRFAIDSAFAELERYLNFSFKQRVIKCDKVDLAGVVYDETEPPYPFKHERWTRVGMIPLRRRPVQSVERFELWSIVDQKILNLLPWMRLNGERGHLHFYPKVGPSGIINVNPIAALGGNAFGGGDYPHGFRIDYTVGMRNAGLVPADVRDIVGKIAACKLLNIIGDGLIAGFSSSSLSLDGVSESFSSTQSATNAYFGARIQVYLKDIESYLQNHKNKFSGFVIGSI